MGKDESTGQALDPVSILEKKLAEELPDYVLGRIKEYRGFDGEGGLTIDKGGKRWARPFRRKGPSENDSLLGILAEPFYLYYVDAKMAYVLEYLRMDAEQQIARVKADLSGLIRLLDVNNAPQPIGRIEKFISYLDTVEQRLRDIFARHDPPRDEKPLLVLVLELNEALRLHTNLTIEHRAKHIAGLLSHFGLKDVQKEAIRRIIASKDRSKVVTNRPKK